MSELVWGIKNGDIDQVKDIVENKVGLRNNGVISLPIFLYEYFVVGKRKRCFIIIYNLGELLIKVIG